MNSQTYTLHEGDSIYLNKFTPHRYKILTKRLM
ncbi:hypothetical protein JTS93_08025 [Clostridium botulinum]|nr:hypothetical protein [Clostridium botulinum]